LESRFREAAGSTDSCAPGRTATVLKCRRGATSVLMADTYTPATRKNQVKQNAAYFNCLAHFSTKAMLASL